MKMIRNEKSSRFIISTEEFNTVMIVGIDPNRMTVSGISSDISNNKSNSKSNSNNNNNNNIDDGGGGSNGDDDDGGNNNKLNARTPSLPNLKASRENYNSYRLNFLTHTESSFTVNEQNSINFNFERGNEQLTPQQSNDQLDSVVTHENLSLIDMYNDATFEYPSSSKDFLPINKDVTFQSSKDVTFQSSKDATFQSSREDASRVRSSIEDSRTSLAGKRDRYGFKKENNYVSEQEYNTWWVKYSKHCARRKNKWELLLKKNGLSLNNDQPLRFPPKSEKLKRYSRKGIPAEWRGHAWWWFARGPEKLKSNQGVYDGLVESTIGLHNKDTEIIERDLNRTFPDNIHFKPDQPVAGEETPLIQALRRVLVAFSVYQPSIGYCQSLNFIAGLLLIFMDEEKAFWMLVIITTRYLPGVHDINLEGVNIDQGVLMLALKAFIPDAWDKISSIDFGNDDPKSDFLIKLPPITLCTSSWFMSTFIGTLPIETTLRVWDCMFYEESNFLFKISLSIFKLLEPQILAMKDEMEIFQIIQNEPKSIIDPSVLFDIIFKKRYGFNSLTQEEINRCKKYVVEKRKCSSRSQEDVEFNRNLLNESLWDAELYGFRKNLPGVRWNNNLIRKMRLAKRR